jgi:hypothetical protein
MYNTNMKLPKDFNVPNNIKSEDFLFRKLTTREVYLDYLAVMSSIDTIRKEGVLGLPKS